MARHRNRSTNPFNSSLPLTNICSIPRPQPNRSMEGPPPQPNGSAEGLPPVRWELVVALKQLLRASHHHREALNAPQPSIASFNESRELREAGVRALTGAQIKELEYRSVLPVCACVSLYVCCVCVCVCACMRVHVCLCVCVCVCVCCLVCCGICALGE